MSTTSLRKIEIKFISILSLCTLFWAATPDAFAISGKNKSVKSVVKTANKSAPKTAGRTSQAPTLNTLLNGLGAPNATDGIEFTWSTWIFINNMQYLEGQYRHIFSKGNSNLETNGLVFPNNAPGLYLTPFKNNLVVMMNTYNVINEEVIVPDVPINKWFNIIIRCKNTTLDIYANGTIVRSINLMGVPKQNYGDVFVGLNGGFDGNVSNLWYYDYALGTAEIQRIVNSGPNTTMIGTSGMSDKLANYLSLRWYFSGVGDSYNPSV